jgi:hypothetical protein
MQACLSFIGEISPKREIKNEKYENEKYENEGIFWGLNHGKSKKKN